MERFIEYKTLDEIRVSLMYRRWEIDQALVQDMVVRAEGLCSFAQEGVRPNERLRVADLKDKGVGI